MDKKIPFPQADDFGKILQILSINNEEYLEDTEFMEQYLGGISDRQVAYYTAAAAYLGLLDGRKFTEKGKELREKGEYARKADLICILLADPVFGRVYVSQKMAGYKFSKAEAGEFIKAAYPEYTDGIFSRRGSTIISWLEWIDFCFAENGR